MEGNKIDGTTFSTVRDCVIKLNKANLKKEDIIAIFPYEGMIAAIWYKQ